MQRLCCTCSPGGLCRGARAAARRIVSTTCAVRRAGWLMSRPCTMLRAMDGRGACCTQAPRGYRRCPPFKPDNLKPSGLFRPSGCPEVLSFGPNFPVALA
jgi:hypothetical protein